MSKALNVAVCQINPTLGNFQKNIDIISKNYKYAVENGADLVVFPEMSITGYPPQDLLNNKEFISQNISCLNELTKSITIPCILGYVDFEDNKKFNAAAVCQDGEIVYKYHKIHLPNYDVFDERRYFHSGDSVGIFDLKVNNSDYKIALQICEDLWEDEYERKISGEIIENNVIKYKNNEIGKIMIDKPYPFGLVKVVDPDLNEFIDSELSCGDAKVKIIKPKWI